LRFDPARSRFPDQIVGCRAMIGEQPQHAAIDGLEDTHPAVENIGRDLVAAVEAAEYETALRQPELAAGEGALGNRPPGIVDEIAVRQRDDLLGPEATL